MFGVPDLFIIVIIKGFNNLCMLCWCVSQNWLWHTELWVQWGAASCDVSFMTQFGSECLRYLYVCVCVCVRCEVVLQWSLRPVWFVCLWECVCCCENWSLNLWKLLEPLILCSPSLCVFQDFHYRWCFYSQYEACIWVCVWDKFLEGVNIWKVHTLWRKKCAYSWMS